MNQLGQTPRPQEGIPKPIIPEKPNKNEADNLATATPPFSDGQEQPVILPEITSIPVTPAVPPPVENNISSAATPEKQTRPLSEADVQPDSEILSTDQASDLVGIINELPKTPSLNEAPGILEENK